MKYAIRRKENSILVYANKEQGDAVRLFEHRLFPGDCFIYNLKYLFIGPYKEQPVEFNYLINNLPIDCLVKDKAKKMIKEVLEELANA